MSQQAVWTVAIVVETVNGDVVLKVTEEQAASLRDNITWLVGNEDDT